MTKAISREAQQYAHGVAAIASNHSAATATAIYAGVFERHRYNSVQVIDCAMSSF
jgi:crotonobetainyl-CoA:carnitine CoA-transferase CaiB-like acyl-CoA transferase